MTKYVLAVHQRAFKYFLGKQKYIKDDPTEYVYLFRLEQIRGLGKVRIVLFDEFSKSEANRSMLNELRQWRGYREIYYELG